jgi:transcriptional regulator with XRE-family HTH domain
MQPKSPAEQVASNVRAELGRHRYTQTAVAQHLGLSQTAVSRRLLGQVPFDVNEIHSLATWFGVPVASLLGEGVAA